MAGDTQSNSDQRELREALERDAMLQGGPNIESSQVEASQGEKIFIEELKTNTDKSLLAEKERLRDITVRFGLIREEFYILMDDKGISDEEYEKLERVETICEQLDELSRSGAISGIELTQYIDELEGVYNEL